MIDLLKPAIGVASLSSPLEVGAEKAPKTVVSLVKVLIQNGFQVESFGSIETADQARETGKQAAAKNTLPSLRIRALKIYCKIIRFNKSLNPMINYDIFFSSSYWV